MGDCFFDDDCNICGGGHSGRCTPEKKAARDLYVETTKKRKDLYDKLLEKARNRIHDKVWKMYPMAGES